MEQEEITMDVRRHYLVEISAEGRERLYGENFPESESPEYKDEFRKLILEGYDQVFVPGIARRDEEESANGMLPLGFASLNRISGNRLRIPVFVRREEVLKIVKPYDVISYGFDERNRCMKTLKMVIKMLQDSGLEAGIWGSAGLEIYTGLPFTDDNSDIDILVKSGPYKSLEAFYCQVNELKEKSGIKIDAELDLPDGYGIKLAELFMNTETVLAKGINGVILINRNEIMNSLFLDA